MICLICVMVPSPPVQPAILSVSLPLALSLSLSPFRVCGWGYYASLFREQNSLISGSCLCSRQSLSCLQSTIIHSLLKAEENFSSTPKRCRSPSSVVWPPPCYLGVCVFVRILQLWLTSSLH